MKEIPVTVSDELKSVLAQCKPGTSKEISILVNMDKGGKISLMPSDAEYGEAGPGEAEMGQDMPEAIPVRPTPKQTVKKAIRPKPVMDAIKAMYA